jgi:glycosyltransferase involved in cell wall biosynthesis
MSQPVKISVVVPTRQRKALLQRCLYALLEQRLPSTDYEIIIVSDGPDNGTRFVAEKYSGRLPLVRYTSLPTQRGPSAARNHGWKLAQGELIAFTDDDCIPERNWLSMINLKWRACTMAEIAFTGKVIVPHVNPPTDYERNIAQLETAEFITANCAITRRALEKCGGFDETFTMAWREDSDLAFNLIKCGIPIVHIQQAVVKHPVRPARWGVSLQEQKKGMFNALLYKKHPELFREKIFAQPFWNYYVIIFSFLLALTGLFTHWPLLVIGGAMLWSIFTVQFIGKRLRNASAKPSHVMEMIITSLFIPFLSVFWTLYGSVKFKTFFL